MITLTGQEIKDLAEIVGFEVVDDYNPDVLKREFCVEDCPKTGIHNDKGDLKHYKHIVTTEFTTGQQCLVVGDELESPVQGLINTTEGK